MTIKSIFRIIFHLLFTGSLFVGCTPGTITSSPSITQYPTRILNTVTPTETSWSTIEPPTSSIIASHLPEGTIIPPTTAPQNPLLQLTFVSDRNSRNYGVYAIEVNCLAADKPCLGEPQLLFEWEDWISEIAWSPDGKHIAFISSEYAGKLFITDENGENAIQITGICEIAGWPQWSPDSIKVAFIYNPARQGCEVLDSSEILIYNLKTGLITKILNNVYSPSRIYWLSEETFLYIGMNSETDRIDMINIIQSDGTLIGQFPHNAKDYSRILDVTFPKNFQQIAFVGEDLRKHTIDIYRLILNINDLINLTPNSGNNLGPAWSPIGDWIAFGSDRSGNYEIYLINANGTELLQITNNPATDTNAAWRMLP